MSTLPCLFSEMMLKNATMTEAEEAIVARGVCPKCSNRVQTISDAGGVQFSQCAGCNDIFCTSVPDTSGSRSQQGLLQKEARR